MPQWCVCVCVFVYTGAGETGDLILIGGSETARRTDD
jgi:hypothetical protein